MAMLAVAAEHRPISGRVIREGDVVIVYERHDRMKAVTVVRNGELQNRFGVFPHNEWIGKQFGTQVLDKNDAGFVYLLAPTPELWTLALPHRTQILYIADISFVVSFLELKPGSVVLESGTGSGSLTHSLARAVSPTGHVHTFDFHEQRANAAHEDFVRNGVAPFVTVKVRDIQGEGFPEELAGRVDGVFLDLPQPWLAIPSVVRSLRSDGLVCSFSPCIEQVQRTCEVLSKARFADIRTFEVLLRSYEVRHENLSTGFDCSEQTEFANSPPHKRQRAGEADVKDRAEGEGHGIEGEDTTNGTSNSNPNSSSVTKSQQRQSRHVIARPYPETKGHTGYLTFARQATLTTWRCSISETRGSCLKSAVNYVKKGNYVGDVITPTVENHFQASCVTADDHLGGTIFLGFWSFRVALATFMCSAYFLQRLWVCFRRTVDSLYNKIMH